MGRVRYTLPMYLKTEDRSEDHRELDEQTHELITS